MKPGLMPLILLAGVLFFSCKKEFVTKESQAFASQVGVTATDNTLDLENGQLKIAVVSDIHYAPSSLFKAGARSGVAYKAYLAADPKMLDVVEPILSSIITDLQREQPDIVLVTGDLTKDGERVSHDSVASILRQLLPAKIFVVPGNHDINNPEARRYDGDNAEPIGSITKEEFASIYENFGYKGGSVVRDPASLSYMAKPYSNLWILAIDASRYEENTDIAIVDGRIKEPTMNWIKAQMDSARSHNATVLTMMHHNLVEHYTGQSYLDPGYTVADWQTTANTLMKAGVNVIFTGHYHANDITSYTNDGKELYDIETGSPLLPPSAYRVIMMKNKNLEINTRYARPVGVNFPGGVDFVSYSDAFISPLLNTYLYNMMMSNFGFPDFLANDAAPLLREAVKAHFEGDERISPAQRKAITDFVIAYSTQGPELKSAAEQVAQMIMTLWTDQGVKDIKTVITYRK